MAITKYFKFQKSSPVYDEDSYWETRSTDQLTFVPSAPLDPSGPLSPGKPMGPLGPGYPISPYLITMKITYKLLYIISFMI